MRVCHIITTLVYGGAERLLVNFSNLHAREHEVHIIYLKGAPQLQGALDPSVQVHLAPLGALCVFRLRALLKRIRPDVVHTHLGHADLLGLIACAGLPVRKLCTMHNVWFKWTWKDQVIFSAYALLFKTMARDCRVVCISQCVADHVRNRLGVPRSRTEVVYNGIPAIDVPESREALRKRLDIPQEGFCILFVGRLRIQKSVDTLLQAIALNRDKMPDLTLILIGEGEEADRLREMRSKLGLEACVQFRGTTPNPEFYFSAADLFVLPSVFEGLGIVILEAFRAGLPVIATDIEGPKEIIRDGSTGILVPPKDPESLGKAILRMHRDPALRRDLGRAGLESFTGNFNIGQYAARLDRLYREPAAS
jgi:glycosyltransferase involved in cell wall biosynthesis